MLNKKGPYRKKGRKVYYVVMEDGADSQGRKRFREVSLRTTSKKEAWDHWHAMQAHDSEVTFTTPVDVLLTQFPDHQQHRTQATYLHRSVAIPPSGTWLGARQGAQVAQLRPAT